MLTKFNTFRLNEIQDQTKGQINKPAETKIRRCFTQILSNYGFFSDLLLQLKIMEAHPSAKVDTMATDGKCIAYNPDFVNKLDDKEVVFVIIHEIMHNANFHFARRGNRDAIVTTSYGKKASLWNWAADYAINPLIDDMRNYPPGGQLIKAPDRVLMDKKYNDLSAEQIYDILLKEIPHEDPKDGDGEPGPIEIYPGMKVRLKNGKTGVVREVDIENDTYIIDEIQDKFQKVVENLYFSKFNKIFEAGPVCKLPTVGNPKSFNRDEFVPILKAGEGQGQGGKGGEKVEFEGEQPKPKPGQDGKGGKGGDPVPESDDIREPGSLGEQGDPLDGYEGSDDLSGSNDAGDIEKKWGEIINTAKSQNPAGTGSPGLDRWFNKIGKPKVNWKRRLLKFINQCFSANPEYGYFNKRYMGQEKPDYLPGMKYPKQEGFRSIYLIIDTSGSIGQDTLSKFASEFYGILTTKKVMETTVIWCDDQIQKVEIMQTSDKSGVISKAEFEKKFLQKLKPRGQGGTSFIPPFKWIEQNVLKKHRVPSFVVYFTDAAGSAPEPKSYGIPAYFKKVLWVITDCDSAPHIKFPEKIFIDKNPDL